MVEILLYTAGMLALTTGLVVASYFDRVYRDLGHAARGKIHDHLDTFETEIEPRFKMERPRAALAGGGNNGSRVAQLVQSPAVLDALKRTNPALHEGIIQAYSHAIDRLFLVAVPVSVLSVIASLFIKHVKLRVSNAAPPAADGRQSDAGRDAIPAAPGGTH